MFIGLLFDQKEFIHVLKILKVPRFYSNSLNLEPIDNWIVTTFHRTFWGVVYKDIVFYPLFLNLSENNLLEEINWQYL